MTLLACQGSLVAKVYHVAALIQAGFKDLTGFKNLSGLAEKLTEFSSFPRIQRKLQQRIKRGSYHANAIPNYCIEISQFNSGWAIRSNKKIIKKE